MKFTPEALSFTTASFAFGCGTGSSTTSIASGPPTCLTRMAFMISLDSRLRIKDSGFVTYGSQVTAELPTLAGRALSENLSPADIKKAIQVWRPDYWRV